MNSLFKEYEGIFDQSLDVPDLNDKKGALYTYSPFALQDAIGEKNIKKIWIEYQKLRLADVTAEDLIYKLIAKTREMLAIMKGASQKDLGIKDYPYSKSKKDAKNWKREELENLYTKFVEIYHGSRAGGDELSIAIEKTLLYL